MEKYQAHKSSLFLMELIIATVFFALASSVCLQLFVKSHLLSRQTKELNTAVNLCSSTAESIRQCEGSEEVLRELMPQLTVSQEKPLLAYYDEEFQACSPGDADYILEILLDTGETMVSAEVSLMAEASKEIIYELPVKVHLPYTWKGGD
nr:hypothetical protein [uncultured Blautia sp.]